MVKPVCEIACTRTEKMNLRRKTVLRSMTAFSRKDVDTEWGSISWEIRSVNSRYLESHFKLPDGFREIEQGLRDIQKNI